MGEVYVSGRGPARDQSEIALAAASSVGSERDQGGRPGRRLSPRPRPVRPRSRAHRPARFRGAGAVTARVKRPVARSKRRIAPAPESATHSAPRRQRERLDAAAGIRRRHPLDYLRCDRVDPQQRPLGPPNPDPVPVCDHRQRALGDRHPAGDFAAAAVHPEQGPGWPDTIFEPAAGHPDGVCLGATPTGPYSSWPRSTRPRTRLVLRSTRHSSTMWCRLASLTTTHSPSAVARCGRAIWSGGSGLAGWPARPPTAAPRRRSTR
jgi:hypothetical protein